MVAIGMRENQMAALFSKTAAMSESFASSVMIEQSLAQEVLYVKRRSEDCAQLLHKDYGLPVDVLLRQGEHVGIADIRCCAGNADFFLVM
ncbi:MAG: hypothetical protein PHD01_13295 [Geobacteraceae bacterium]|nr:hypothetical protein [Geobacteraceae bacterium]